MSEPEVQFARRAGYEYAVRTVGDWQDVEAFLNQMAEEGWELLSFVRAGSNSYCCVFRREWCRR